MSTYLDVLRYRELLGNLFRRDLQAKYRGSALGVLWTIANPVMLMGVYLLVFGVVWKSPFATGGHYPLFLLTGLALWTFFAAAVQSSTRSMLDNANLIRMTRFPRQLVPPEDPVALRGAIERVLGDPELARSLGSAARARVERANTSPGFAERLAPLLRSAASTI